MKKILLSAVVLFAAVAGYNCYNNSSASDDEMSDLIKANLEALAREVKPRCFYEPLYPECTVYNQYSHCYYGL